MTVVKESKTYNLLDRLDPKKNDLKKIQSNPD